MKNILGKRLQNKSRDDQLKLEPAFLAQNEEVLATYGYYRARAGTYPSKKFPNKGFRKPDKQNQREKNQSQWLRWKSCGSFRHFIADCPDSFKNDKRKSSALVAEEVSSDENEQEPEDINRFVLFTSRLR